MTIETINEITTTIPNLAINCYQTKPKSRDKKRFKILDLDTINHTKLQRQFRRNWRENQKNFNILPKNPSYKKKAKEKLNLKHTIMKREKMSQALFFENSNGYFSVVFLSSTLYIMIQFYAVKLKSLKSEDFEK